MKIVKEDWLKLIEFEEQEDRISSLSDCLIVEILFRLQSTKEAITTSTLSKRWKHVWTLIPAFDFTDYKENDMVTPTLSGFVSLVEKTLNQCSSQLKLNKFQLFTRYDEQFESQLNNWIRYAKNRDVDLNLMLGTLTSKAEFVLDEFVFTSSCFTHLKLGYCIFNPVGAISWPNLKTLYIKEGKLDEDLIENILSGSPLLETLNLQSCFGFRRVDITSTSIKNFGLFGVGSFNDGVDILEINAPHISTLTIRDTLFLKRLFLLDVSSLVKAKLDYCRWWYRHSGEEQKEDEEMLKRLMLNLRHVNALSLGEFCSGDLSCLKAKGFVTLLNMKVLYFQ